MNRPRVTALLASGLLAVSLAQPSWAQPPRPGPRRPDPVGRALERLRTDADAAVRVHRDPTGTVDLVRSADGDALVSAPAGSADGPQVAARAYVQRYGPAFHVDGSTSTAEQLTTLPAPTGGAVVRAQQQVDGRPVFGGELVMSLDRRGGLVSVAGATTGATSVAGAAVPAERARRTAVAVAAKAHRVSAGHLAATDEGEWLYDPTLVGVPDPLGPRPVRRFEVSGPSGMRELVLVDLTRGGVPLHFDESGHLDRAVCDDANALQAVDAQNAVPECTSTAPRLGRSEASGPADQGEVDKAFDNIGEAADFYREVGGLDLGRLVGTVVDGRKTLQSWVRWCDTSDGDCPMRNAFWDGRHMLLGDGYAGADDVVVHELTHAVIDHTSRLFYLHQSGAINESLADVMGELADHRYGTDDDSGWTIGEDLPGGAVRSLQAPARFDQPAGMSGFAVASALDDSGAVHQNSGIGNQAAYLISQGGTLDGAPFAGIDAGDPSLTKTATLYLQVTERLTSGAQYADLARTLVGTCQELAAAGTAGFTTADCTSVADAVSATGMARAPRGAATDAPGNCPAGTVKQMLFHDDDRSSNHWATDRRTLWGRDSSYAGSGEWSWFAYDPDPTGYGDRSSSVLWPTTGIAIPRGRRSYLRFRQAYVLEWYAPASYPDGGRVRFYTRTAGGSWRLDHHALRWVNGPDETVDTGSGAPWRGFAGDSHGWGSSRVNLTPLAGRMVRPQWQVAGDRSGAFYGWWLDAIDIYSCRSARPSAPRAVTATRTAHGVTVTWRPPAWRGSGVAGYRLRRADGRVRRLPAAARSATFRSLRRPVTVRAVNRLGRTGAGATLKVPR